MKEELILGIDTSGKTASAAICAKDRVLSQISVLTNLTHSQVMLPICEEVLKNAGLVLGDMSGIAVAKGPGSYTGLRIGIAAVKAMAFASGIGCAGVSTLKGLAYNFRGGGFRGHIFAVMEARNDLFYISAFNSDGTALYPTAEDLLLPAGDIMSRLSETGGDIMLTGDGAENLYKRAGGKSGGRLWVSSPHLRLQSAACLCYAVFDGKKLSGPESLNPDYLEITKAEKELNEKSRK